jgi:D-psicose/D-tagatose/L-ribulose 3-epimerase
MQEAASPATSPPAWAPAVHMTPAANPLGASAWIWRSRVDDRALGRIVPRAATLGFDQLELPFERMGGWDPRGAAELLAEHGLAATVCSPMPPAHGARDHLRACVDAARALRAPVVSGPLYGEAPGRRRALPRLALQLRELAAYADHVAVTLAIEPVNRYESALVNTAEQALELVELVDSPNCGVALDTFHMNIEERDPAAAIRAAGERLVHFHACANDRGAPGSDHVYWSAIAEALCDVGYSGPLTIEAFELPEERARDGLRFLRSLLVQAR